MLPVKNRLKKGLFNSIYQRGTRVYGRVINLIYAKNGSSLSQFGFIVSKKKAPKAFQRNKLKRAMREAVRGCLRDVKGGYDIVLSFNKNSNMSAKEERNMINEEIKLLFSKVRLFLK